MEFKTGIQIEIDIADFGVNGEGIGKCGEFVVFVENAVPGDRVLVELTGVKKNYGFGRVIETLERSENRIEPECAVFGACGGCDFLHIGYETELEFKKKSVNDALRRIGGLDFEVERIIGMDEPRFYRNKAVYHVASVCGKTEIGFYGKKSKDVTPASDCVMFGSENGKIIAAFKEYMTESGVRPFDAKTGRGLVTGLMVRRSSHTGDILICVLAAQANLPNKAGLVYHLTESVKQITGITLDVSKHGVVCTEPKFIWGEKFITEKIGKYVFRVSAPSFFQVNGKMTPVLFEKVAEYACLSEKDVAVDAYAGTGTVTINLSERARKVIGIELSPGAVIDAEQNAGLNGISNVEFIQGDTGETLVKLFEEGIRPAAVILDPPRRGCAKNVIDGLAKLKPERIVYVSCAPATLARDLKEITGLGYVPEKGVCVDMFARCAHVETVVALTRKM